MVLTQMKRKFIMDTNHQTQIQWPLDPEVSYGIRGRRGHAILLSESFSGSHEKPLLFFLHEELDWVGWQVELFEDGARLVIGRLLLFLVRFCSLYQELGHSRRSWSG